MSDDDLQAFWERFLRSPAARLVCSPQCYGTMRVGLSPDDADAGAELILDERKTATSSHPSEYGTQGPPFVGALSIVVDGSDQPVAIVETIEVELRKLKDLDDAFAEAYGEWDQTAETLRSELATYYSAFRPSEGGDAAQGMELLCERFRIIYSER